MLQRDRFGNIPGHIFANGGGKNRATSTLKLQLHVPKGAKGRQGVLDNETFSDDEVL